MYNLEGKVEFLLIASSFLCVLSEIFRFILLMWLHDLKCSPL